MSESILTSTKKILGIPEADTTFDLDILIHINSVFSTLTQLGIGPDTGFGIEDKITTWDAFLGGNPRIASVKTYMYLKVRLYFDPPGTSFVIGAMEKQVEELEWRLNVEREHLGWVDPFTQIDIDEDELVLDGGAP